MKVSAPATAAAAAVALLCAAALLPGQGGGQAARQPRRALWEADSDAVASQAAPGAAPWAPEAPSPHAEPFPLLVTAFQGPTDGASAAALLGGWAGAAGGVASAGAGSNTSACPCRDNSPPNGDCLQQRDAGQW